MYIYIQFYYIIKILSFVFVMLIYILMLANDIVHTDSVFSLQIRDIIL